MWLFTGGWDATTIALWLVFLPVALLIGAIASVIDKFKKRK